MTVLVAWAGAHGSTREIAERIAARLEERGHRAVAMRVGEVEDVAAHQAVVLGSAVRNGAWLPEATALTQRCSPDLAARPLWLFSVGMLGDTSSALGRRLTRVWQPRNKGPVPVTRLREQLRPRGHRSFAGVVRRQDWRGWSGLSFRLLGGRFGDHRDWDDVAAWADVIADALPAD